MSKIFDSIILLLSSYGIYTRHWHVSDQNSQGYHEFIGYYNPEKHKWIIVGPYSGIQYKKDGELLSVLEIIKAITEGNKINEIITMLDTRLYFDKKIENIWRKKLILGRVCDYISCNDPENRYGFLGKWAFFNKLPLKIKKLARIFGRNNSMYEVYNFEKPKKID